MHIQPASRQADRMTDVITGPHDILLRHVTAVLVPDPVLFCAVCGAVRVPRRRSRRGAGAGGMHIEMQKPQTQDMPSISRAQMHASPSANAFSLYNHMYTERCRMHTALDARL
jgi:hypothetical protein